MSETDPCCPDAASLDDLLDRTVEVPAVLVLAAAGGRGCCCC